VIGCAHNSCLTEFNPQHLISKFEVKTFAAMWLVSKLQFLTKQIFAALHKIKAVENQLY
jgi:hypothetical protein